MEEESNHYEDRQADEGHQDEDNLDSPSSKGRVNPEISALGTVAGFVSGFASPVVGFPILYAANNTDKGKRFLGGLGISAALGVLLSSGINYTVANFSTQEIYNGKKNNEIVLIGSRGEPQSVEDKFAYLTSPFAYWSPKFMFKSNDFEIELSLGSGDDKAVYGFRGKGDLLTVEEGKYDINFDAVESFSSPGNEGYLNLEEIRRDVENKKSALEREVSEGNISGARDAKDGLTESMARYTLANVEYNGAKEEFKGIVDEMNSELDRLGNYAKQSSIYSEWIDNSE